MTQVAKNLLLAFMTKKILSMMDDNIVKNRMIAPGGNMGLQRSMMPQIAANRLSEYFRHMKSNGVTFKEKTLKTSELKLVQAEYNKDKVLNLMKQYKKGDKAVGRIIVSKDGFVLDGSHRFLAKHNSDPTNADIDVHQANVKIADLLSISRKFAGVQFRTWTDNSIKPTANN